MKSILNISGFLKITYRKYALLPQSNLTLLYNPISPPARAVLLMMKQLNLEAEKHDINILTKGYLKSDLMKINPQHTVPTLIDNGFVIWDSHAINGYLVNQYADDDSLYPKNPKLRAVVDQRMHFDSGVLYPCLRKLFYPILFNELKQVDIHTQNEVNNAYNFLEAFLEKHSWLAGDSMTIADLSCITSVSTLNELVPVTTSRLRLFMDQCKQLPFYKEANEKGLDQLMFLVNRNLTPEPQSEKTLQDYD